MINRIKVLLILGITFISLCVGVKGISTASADTSYVGGGTVNVIYKNTTDLVSGDTSKTWSKNKISSNTPQTGISVKNINYTPIFSISILVLVILLWIYRKETKKEN